MSDKSSLGLKRLFGNTSLTLARQLTVGVIQLVSIAIIARVLGPSGNGEYALSLLIPMTLSALLNLGVGPANIYYLASGKVSITRAFIAINRFALLITFVGLIIGITAIYYFSEVWMPDVDKVYLYLALSVYPVVLYQSLLMSIFQGVQNFKFYNKTLLIQPIVLLILISLLVVLNIFKMEYIIYSVIVSYIFSIIVGLKLYRNLTTNSLSVKKCKQYEKNLLTYGYKSHLSNILAFLNYKTDIFLVNFFINPAAAGIYVIAVQLVERLWIFSKSVSTALFPFLSEASNDRNKINQITPIACRNVIAITFVSAVIFGSIASLFIDLVFGDKYAVAGTALLLLLPGIVATSGSRTLANDISARGKPELNMYVSVIVLLVNIIGNIMLIPNYGLEGAALATSIAYILNLIMRLFIYKHLSNNSFIDTVIFKKSDMEKILKLYKKIVLRKAQ